MAGKILLRIKEIDSVICLIEIVKGNGEPSLLAFLLYLLYSVMKVVWTKIFLKEKLSFTILQLL